MGRLGRGNFDNVEKEKVKGCEKKSREMTGRVLEETL